MIVRVNTAVLFTILLIPVGRATPPSVASTKIYLYRYQANKCARQTDVSSKNDLVTPNYYKLKRFNQITKEKCIVVPTVRKVWPITAKVVYLTGCPLFFLNKTIHYYEKIICNSCQHGSAEYWDADNLALSMF